jgi:hypothetical protein
MAHKGLIVVKKKDQLLPDAFLEKTVTAYKSCYGCAIITHDGAPELIELSSTEAPTVDAVNQIQKEFKDKIIVFHFGDFPAGFNEDDKQPFVLLEDDNKKPIMVGFLEGDFNGFAKAGSSHSDAFFVVNEYLKPRLKEDYQKNNNSMLALVGSIKSPRTKRELEAQMGESGTITLMPITGDMTSFVRGANHADFPAFWTSNALGYGEGTTAVGLAAQLKQKMGKSAAALLGAVAGPKSDLPPKPPKTETATAPVIETELKMGSPERNWSKNQKKNWYEKYAGFVPPNYKDCPQVPIKNPGKIIKSVTELVPSQESGYPPREKDITTHHIPHDEKAVVVEVIPVIPPSEKTKLTELFKILNTSGQRMPTDVDDIARIEGKYATFAQVSGLKGLEDTFNLPYTFLCDLCKECPKAAALLIMNYRASYIPTLGEEYKPPAEQPVEKPPAEPAAPTKKSKLASMVPPMAKTG